VAIETEKGLKKESREMATERVRSMMRPMGEMCDCELAIQLIIESKRPMQTDILLKIQRSIVAVHYP